MDTAACAAQFRAFDRRAPDLREANVAVWFITRDLPFTLARSAAEHDIEHLRYFSDFREREFGAKLGLTVDEFDLLARSVLVVDQEAEVIYEEIVPELRDEPDYDAAVEAAREASA